MKTEHQRAMARAKFKRWKKKYPDKYRERHNRWLHKHPEKIMNKLSRWLEREKDPVERNRCMDLIVSHLNAIMKNDKKQGPTIA